MLPTNKLSLLALRLAMGWFYFYAGITKVLDPEWSAAGYLKNAKGFTAFYQWMLDPSILPVVNFFNEWGLTLLGVSLILGIFVRLSSSLGMVLMLLYYLALGFPFPNAHAFIVDEHIIYIAALFVLASQRAGTVWGLETWCAELPICKKYPRLRAWFG